MRVTRRRVEAAVNTLADLSSTSDYSDVRDSDLIGQVIFLLEQELERRDVKPT